MESFISHLLQIGILVEDVDAAVKHYETEYGIGPWNVIDFGPGMFPKMLVDGKPGMVEFRAAFCKAFGMEIELIQPVNRTVYKDWLEKHGNGIHHIAVRTRDKFDDVIAEHKKLTGRDPWIHAKEDNGKSGEGMEYAYLDLRKELGLFLEIYNEDRSGGHPFK
jgi:methylmalonyl-CoA/ethylmalonyl-CoA epimerase